MSSRVAPDGDAVAAEIPPENTEEQLRAARAQLQEQRVEVERLRTAKEAAEKRLEWSLDRLARNTQAFWAPLEVQRRPMASVSALEFARDFVATSTPLVFTDLDERTWPCLSRWTDSYLMEAVGSTEVSVNVTAGGLGDYVNECGQFVKPLEDRMRFTEFWSWLRSERGSTSTAEDSGVPYLSHQNDSLREELPMLVGDVPQSVALGVRAFGNEPEAINLWIGDGRAVSSCHKDHYENLYAVVRGEKVFSLLPPSAAPFLGEQRCPAAHFERTFQEGASALRVAVDDDADEVPWVPVNVTSPDLRRFPAFARAKVLEVHVRPREMLYLPAMWYHQVAQVGLTIAVNYWHDMQFGHAFVHHHFLRDLSGLNDHEPNPLSDIEDED